MPDRLLAKSYDRVKYPDAPPRYALLTQHTLDVVEACDALAAVVGRGALINVGIDPGAFDRFRKTLRANAWIQDLGKANSQMQEMLRTNPQIRQLVRHETLSGLLVWNDSRLREWISSLSDALPTAVWGAMGHHRKFDQRTAPARVSPLRVYVTHSDFKAILAWMASDLGLPKPPCFEQDIVVAETRRELCDICARDSLDRLIEEFEDLESRFDDAGERRFLALVKSFGIAGDVAASAFGPRFEKSVRRSMGAYVRQTVGGVGLSEMDLSRLINNWAWNHTECSKRHTDENVPPPGFVPYQFQEDVAASSSSLTLAQGGCGTGKSLAAYMWARTWCAQRTREGTYNFRLFVCLPTTGTASEHFKDYALESGLDVNLTHSRASVDLTTIAETAPQEEADEQPDASAAALAILNAERDKIESLKLWSTPLVVGTVDTVLGLMANARRSVLSLPAIMSAAIVFDEIHAYDQQLFGHLLLFLKNFPRLPVLLMTASLPQNRLTAIQAVRPDLVVVPGPPEYETLERYIIATESDDNSLWAAVEDCVKHKGKVLWVRNQVEWANETYRKCRVRNPNAYVNVYHSRLRYKDRSKRHRRVIDQFKSSGEAAILVATQVAEMSLDLSADLLITDVSPISALIQRLGRLNRRATPQNKEKAKVGLICPLPPSAGNSYAPYDKEEIEQATRWVQEIMEMRKEISQRDLADTFAVFCRDGDFDLATAEERAWFFGVPGKSGIWRTRPGFTRDTGYTVSVILETDLKACAERNRNGQPTSSWLRKFEVSIPVREQVLSWRRVAGVHVAPTNMVEYDYDETTEEGTGAKWISR